MTTRQGDLALLDEPVAQQLLRSTIPARLAYTWTDGTPRVVPIQWHWNGEELVLGTSPEAPKMAALRNGTKVALTIDTDGMPARVLLIRGAVRTDVVDGLAPEYVAMSRRVMGEEGSRAWLAQTEPLFPRMVRIFVRPEWVGLIDFETRFPSIIERPLERLQAQG